VGAEEEEDSGGAEGEGVDSGVVVGEEEDSGVGSEAEVDTTTTPTMDPEDNLEMATGGGVKDRRTDHGTRLVREERTFNRKTYAMENRTGPRGTTRTNRR